ncbi:MAG: ATP-binding cassette domain-containing protein [Firmicutes bacterium]|nr:ATP-binding cassette domain-containing protein [Bacillota bacterium]
MSLKSDFLKAVDGVSFDILRGETLGLVGESGCGKTTLGRVIICLEKATSGNVYFEDTDVFNLSKKDLRDFRRNMQIIFQDPCDSLNPRMTVEEIVSEPLIIYGVHKKAELKTRVASLLEVVGLSPSHSKRFPHEFSGGQRQRIGVARALALNPKFIVCDEPVSALDVSIQSQTINLLEDLQQEFGLTYLFISHDLSVVKHISDRIAVMYLGKIVELAHRVDLYSAPLHPYTKALLSAVPVPNPRLEKKRIILEGSVPSAQDRGLGCCFNTRCWLAEDICREVEPSFDHCGSGHFVACHLVDKSEGPVCSFDPERSGEE